MLYHIGYNGINFILLGKGGSGNALPQDVLKDKTFTNDDGPQTGTMKNNGTQVFTPGTNNIPLGGYYNSDSYIKGEPNLKPKNIINGTSIFGIEGIIDMSSFIFKYPAYALDVNNIPSDIYYDRNTGKYVFPYSTVDYYLGNHKLQLKYIEYSIKSLIITKIQFIFPKNVLFIYRPNHSHQYFVHVPGYNNSHRIFSYYSEIYFPKNNNRLIFPFYNMDTNNNAYMQFAGPSNPYFTNDTCCFNIQIRSGTEYDGKYENCFYSPFYVVFNESIPDSF